MIVANDSSASASRRCQPAGDLQARRLAGDTPEHTHRAGGAWRETALRRCHGGDGLLLYRYRGTDQSHRDNVGLRRALEQQVPLVYLYGVVEGEYLPMWPVYIVGDDPAALCFKVAVDDRKLGAAPPPIGDVAAEARRSYITRVTVQRLHQEAFRQRVRRAYQERCAICRLLHHKAFDRHILGVRPDLVVEVRRDILEETDGPMLLHGLQEIAGERIGVPRSERKRPRTEFLEERYEIFRKAS